MNLYESVSSSDTSILTDINIQLNHLLDLKQKQANVSEALSARKQAENTTHHAENASESARKSMGLAELANEQSQETARQGKTVMLFTVITIIFVS